MLPTLSTAICSGSHTPTSSTLPLSSLQLKVFPINLLTVPSSCILLITCASLSPISNDPSVFLAKYIRLLKRAASPIPSLEPCSSNFPARLEYLNIDEIL